MFVKDTMPSLISETERTEKRIAARWRQDLDEGRFFRFNVDQGLQSVGLADFQQEGLIDAASTTYLNLQTQLFRVRDCVKRLVQKQMPSPPELHETIHSFVVARAYNQQLQVRADLARAQGYASREEVLSSLYFAEHDARIRMLDPPWQETFEWISEPRRDVDSPDFLRWLRSGSEVFWISGKLGSGKSTIMAHILHNQRTRQELEAWAQPKKLQIISFFFWRAGSQAQGLQNTIAGLLRSLLFQLLDQIAGLVEAMSKMHGLRDGRIAPWTESSLRRLLHDAIGAASNDKVCFFIDGLDEFQGDYNKLVKDVCSIFQRHPHAKLCVSSRPEEPLVHRLGSFPRLQMEELNFPDIERYVAAHMDSFGQRYQRLCREICHGAEGVFLWAVVVTEQTVLGIQSGEDFELLKRRIEQLPREMNDLFQTLLKDIDQLHKDTLAFFLTSMALVTELDIDAPSVAHVTAALAPADWVSYADFARQCESRSRQVYAYSKGLLQVDYTWYEGGAPHREVEAMWSVSEEILAVGLRASEHDTALVPAHAAIRARRPVWHDRGTSQDLAERRVIRYLLSSLEWTHRSAYDFVMQQDVHDILGLDEPSGRPMVILKLLDSHLRIMATAPTGARPRFPGLTGSASSMLLPSSSERMRDMIRLTMKTDEIMQEQSHGSLDELRELVIHMAPDDLEGLCDTGLRGSIRVPSADNAVKADGIDAQRSEMTPEASFWSCCVEAALLPYVHSRLGIFDAIDDSGVTVAAVIEANCRGSEWKNDALPSTIWTLDFELMEAGAMFLEDLLKILRARRMCTLSSPQIPPQVCASLLNKTGYRACYCDITWTSTWQDERRHKADEAVVCNLSLAWLWWSEHLGEAILRNTLHGKQLENAHNISRLFMTLLQGEWDVHIGTQFWKPKRFLPGKITLQASIAGLPQTELRYTLPEDSFRTLGVDKQPAFRLFYNVPDWASVRLDVPPIHDVSVHFVGWQFAQFNLGDEASVMPEQRKSRWGYGNAELHSLLRNSENFCEALVEDVRQRRPASQYAEKFVQALEDGKHGRGLSTRLDL
ncbi:hypothetical protein LTR53_010898 [Teratosphaeriaceae sp. CCFEE 6253]|nr:hypothetical protein LTR53_010898 [Teratosphaeriaceae sp. CCFEE 6253]